MKIPYRISDRISKGVSLSDQFYRGVQDVLLASCGLDLLIVFLYENVLKSAFTSHNTTHHILRHILQRTIYFNKLFEFIRITDITKGKMTIGIPPAPVSERVVKTGLKELSNQQVLIRIKLSNKIATTPLYGLNLFHLLQVLEVRWKTDILETTHYENQCPKSYVALLAQKKLVILIDHLKGEFEDSPDFEPIFERLLMQKDLIEDVGKFVEELKTLLPEQHYRYGMDFEKSLKNCRVLKKDLKPVKWRDDDLLS